MNIGIILRGWKNLKNKREIDILVSSKEFEKLRKKYKVHNFFDTFHIFKLEDDRVKDFHIHVNKLTWNFIPYLDGTDALKRPRKFRNLKIPPEDWYVAEVILHAIVDAKKFKEEYKEEIKKFKKWENVGRILEKNLGKGLSKEIVEKAKKTDFDGLLKLRWKIILSSAIRNLSKVPLALLAILRKKLLPRVGPLIIFVGPDGAGKTTLAEETAKFLEKNGVKVCKTKLGIYNKRTALLRTAEKITKRRRLKIPDFVKNVFRFLDMWARYLRVFPERLRNKAIICDRYFYDLAFYSEDFSGYLLAKLSPKPTFAFLVYVDVNELLKRKREYKKEELKKHLARMFKLAKEFELIKVENYELKKSLKKIKKKIVEKGIFLAAL